MARRDPAAFAEFVAARSGALHRSAYLMVGEERLAQDLVQRALTRTYAAWPWLRDPGSAESYARRAVTAALRDGHTVEPPDRVWQALLDLPPGRRAAIVLRHHEDLTEARTAAALGWTVDRVRSQVSAGLRTLPPEQLLEDALAERAATLPPHRFDVALLVREGARQASRRRTALLGAGAVAALVAAASSCASRLWRRP